MCLTSAITANYGKLLQQAEIITIKEQARNRKRFGESLKNQVRADENNLRLFDSLFETVSPL